MSRVDVETRNMAADQSHLIIMDKLMLIERLYFGGGHN